MSLPAPSARKSLTRRNITSEGFLREDGLIDIEGSLTDVRGFPAINPWRTAPAGHPVHLMRLRITMDSERTIREVVAITEHAPYPLCQQAVPNLQYLVGQVIGPGFNRRMQQLVGNTAGCTHLVTLIQAIANEAMQTLASSRRHSDGQNALGSFPSRVSGKPPLIDSCIAYAADSPVVKVIFPEINPVGDA
ncbi:MAG: DUF2889 domain-containing protein [Azonexus sp.]|jgi:hypothetical protein|nr:DUF2889 domain-containing protein [Azonexus sp.]